MEARSREAIPAARAEVLAIILKTRHRGEEDVTVITQDAVLATFDKLLGPSPWASPASPPSASPWPASW